MVEIKNHRVPYQPFLPLNCRDTYLNVVEFAGTIHSQPDQLILGEEGSVAARNARRTEAVEVAAQRPTGHPDIHADERGAAAVAVVQWPEEKRLLEHFVALGRPRLLVIDDRAEPPDVTDTLEDWVRESADERDRQARIDTLSRRAGQVMVPVFDGMCRLRFGDLWAPLSPIEYRLALEMVERFRRIVTNRDLAARAWGDSPPQPNALRVHLMRLRRRLKPLGLEILTIRGQGHVMQESGSRPSLPETWPALVANR